MNIRCVYVCDWRAKRAIPTLIMKMKIGDIYIYEMYIYICMLNVKWSLCVC